MQLPGQLVDRGRGGIQLEVVLGVGVGSARTASVPPGVAIAAF